MKFQIKLLFLFLFSISVQAENIDIKKIQPGELITITWNEQPVYVYRRTDDQIDNLKNKRVFFDKRKHFSALTFIARARGNERASNLNYASQDLEENPFRSKRKDILVINAVSTLFGCFISLKPKNAVFYDPCSETEYGLDGRIINPNNREYYHLLMPPHYYENGQLILGIKNKDEVPYIDFSPDFSTSSLSSDDLLMEALEWKKYDVFHSTLKKNININHETATGATALYFAATRGRPAEIRALLKLGFNVNHISKSGITPLQMALMGKYSDNIIELLCHGARIDKFCNEDRCTKPAVNFLSDIASNMTETQLMEYVDKSKHGRNNN